MQEMGFGGFDMSDFGVVFGESPGGGRRGGRARDVQVPLNLTFLEAVRGVEKVQPFFCSRESCRGC